MPDSTSGGTNLELLHPIGTDIDLDKLKYAMANAVSKNRGFFLNTVTTDDSRKRNDKPQGKPGGEKYDPGNHCLDPVAIPADYDDKVVPPTDEQLIELGLSLPTVRVKSGGGDHLWWFLKEDSCTKEQRNKIVERIAIVTRADPRMKSHSRIFRLPGSIHLKNPAEPKLVTITETNYDRRYTSVDFDKFLAATEPKQQPKSEPKSKSKPKAPSPSPSSTEDRSTVGEHPPLDYFFRVDLQERLDGVEIKVESQDCGAFDIAAEAIGCAKWLDDYGRLYIGNPLEYLNRYCDGCKPEIAQVDRDRIWASATSRNPNPSITHQGMVRMLAVWDDKEKSESSEDRKCGFYSSINEGLVLVHLVKSGDEGMVKQTTKIGSHLQAIAYLNNPENDGAALYLEMQDIRGQISKITLLRGDLAGDGTTLVKQLLDKGYDFKRKQKPSLLDYLHGLGGKVEKTYTLTQSTGWYGIKSFVLPHTTIGDDTIKYRDVEPSPDVITETKGDLDGWKDNVAKYCDLNSRLIFGLGLAFAAPLLTLVGMQGFGFHLVGESSKGKTTAMLVAASVIGEKKPTTWLTTANGLEAIASAHNELLLLMDEIGQGDPRELAKVAYLLGNGQGKTRMTKALVNRETKTWKLVVLSSGEKGIAAYMGEANITQKSGQEVRLADIPAVPHGSPFGVFETIHRFDSSKEFAQNLEAASRKYRGTAIESFLTQLIANLPDSDELTKRVLTIAKSLSVDTTDHAVSRVANHFALVQVALELAHSFDILPFPVDRVEWSVKKMFDDWLSNRGGDGSIEIKQACDRIRHLLVTNEHSDRIYDLTKKHEGGGIADQTVRNLLAYRLFVDNTKIGAACVSSTHELLVPPAVFKNEFAGGVNEAQLIAELQLRGWMVPPDAEGKAAVRKRVKGKQSRYYVFTNECLCDVEEDLKQPENQPQYEELF